MKIIQHHSGQYEIHIPETVEDMAIVLSQHYTEHFYNEHDGLEWAEEEGWEELWRKVDEDYKIKITVEFVRNGSIGEFFDVEDE